MPPPFSLSRPPGRGRGLLHESCPPNGKKRETVLARDTGSLLVLPSYVNTQPSTLLVTYHLFVLFFRRTPQRHGLLPQTLNLHLKKFSSARPGRWWCPHLGSEDQGAQRAKAVFFPRVVLAWLLPLGASHQPGQGGGARGGHWAAPCLF